VYLLLQAGVPCRPMRGIRLLYNKKASIQAEKTAGGGLFCMLA
jgi:hypothetical protein